MLKPLISIIIPVYNEARALPLTLAGLTPAPDLEVVVVDGGSTDGAWEAAGRYSPVIRRQSPMGRGIQMNTGALAARGGLLTFLHADTLIGPAHVDALRRAASDPSFKAGAFELGLTPPLPALRLIAWGANLRVRLFGLPYGDQVLSLRRDLFFTLGGYSHRRPEDLDLVLRLKPFTRLRLLKPPVASSGRKWLAQGYFRTTVRNWLYALKHLAERAFTRRWPDKGDLPVLMNI
jgi:rSAM/selenodomain-associated transferase 2